MKEVFIVVASIDYEGEWLVAVCADKDTAEIKQEEYRKANGHGENYDIQTWEVQG